MKLNNKKNVIALKTALIFFKLLMCKFTNQNKRKLGILLIHQYYQTYEYIKHNYDTSC